MARAQRATDRSPRRKRQRDMDALTGLNLDFSESPTVWKFLNDDSFVRGLDGSGRQWQDVCQSGGSDATRRETGAIAD